MRVLRAFESAKLEYVLIGAAAMAFHGLVRATADLDLIIRGTQRTSTVFALHYGRLSTEIPIKRDLYR